MALKVAAVLSALLFGVVGGLATDYYLDDPSRSGDPLALGISLDNQSCTGDSLLVLGRGDNRASLRSVIVNAEPGREVRYLDVDASCRTTYSPADQEPSDYAVYLGPFPDATAACTVRMTPRYDRGAVTQLSLGNDQFVRCPCEMSSDVMPDLTPAMQATDEEGTWIKALQRLLVDLGRLREDVDQTGLYSPRTVEAVRALQLANGEPVTGVVDEDTWRLVIARACRLYDY